jgi:DinB superfamily
MDGLEFFWLRRDNLPAAGAEVLDAPDALLRARPHGLPSVAWLLWHISRCEDVGVNRIVVDCGQVLDRGSWTDRLQVPRRDIGTEMTDAEVDELSARIDVSVLREYWHAVTEQTTQVVRALRPEHLDEPVDLDQLHRLVSEEGVIATSAGWVEEVWRQQPNRGWFLAQLALTHSWEHISAARLVLELVNRA